MPIKQENQMLGLGLHHDDSYRNVIHDYEPLEDFDKGTYGCVWKAVNKHSGDVVAIKEFKDINFSSWKEYLYQREVKALRLLGDNPNIVKLKQLIMEDNVLYLVMECMDMTLTQFMRDIVKKFSSNDRVHCVVIQLFQALAHMHRRGYFHRDLKPDSILVSDDVVKVADLGMAREVSMDGDEMYTEYVTTRWYKLLKNSTSTYGMVMDMWAIGDIMAKLITLMSLFQGSSLVDQI